MTLGAATRTATTSVITAVALMSSVGAQVPDLGELLGRAAAYVAAYERELGSLIADEQYSQRSSVGEGLARGRSVETRDLLSEFVMLKLPETASEWAGYRNVLRVDGRLVSDADRRFNVEAFRTSSNDTVSLWKQLNDESARYNIGPITRTINVPTLPLIVLRADRQVFFTHRIDDPSDRVDGMKAVVVAYEELDPPTLASDPKGAPVYTGGRIWLASDTGQVLRTEFVTRLARGKPPFARITVRYGRDPRLGAWVPVEMKEDYSFYSIRLECLARYSNYRRFETGARIVPQSPS